jgi:hypothetical protein
VHTVLSGTLGSSATLVKLPLTSIAFLNYANISCFDDCVFSQEMHVLVPQSETTLNFSGFHLTAKYGYYTEGSWDFKAEVC